MMSHPGEDLGPARFAEEGSPSPRDFINGTDHLPENAIALLGRAHGRGEQLGPKGTASTPGLRPPRFAPGREWSLARRPILSLHGFVTLGLFPNWGDFSNVCL